MSPLKNFGITQPKISFRTHEGEGTMYLYPLRCVMFNLRFLALSLFISLFLNIFEILLFIQLLLVSVFLLEYLVTLSSKCIDILNTLAFLVYEDHLYLPLGF